MPPVCRLAVLTLTAAAGDGSGFLMLVPHPDLFPVPVSRRVAALSRLPTAARTRAAFVSGCAIGIHGGLIGLGGAGFRLPVVITSFRFPALEAALLNKVMNLVVKATALPSRAGTVPLSELAAHWSMIVKPTAGSLVGAWIQAGR